MAAQKDDSPPFIALSYGKLSVVKHPQPNWSWLGIPEDSERGYFRLEMFFCREEKKEAVVVCLIVYFFVLNGKREIVECLEMRFLMYKA